MHSQQHNVVCLHLQIDHFETQRVDTRTIVSLLETYKFISDKIDSIERILKVQPDLRIIVQH